MMTRQMPPKASNVYVSAIYDNNRNFRTFVDMKRYLTLEFSTSHLPTYLQQNHYTQEKLATTQHDLQNV